MIIKNKNKRGKRSICICLNCGEEFSQLDTKIRAGEGKFCSNNCYKEYRCKNKKDPKECNKLYQKKHKYGLNETEYKKMFLEQNNKCLICGRSFDDTLKAYVDHNHQTQKVRGLLCNRCNLLLGLAQDSTELLKNAVNYLEKQQTE